MKAKEWLKQNKGKFPVKVRSFWDPEIDNGAGGEVKLLVDSLDVITNPGALSGMLAEEVCEMFEEVLELALNQTKEK